MNPQPARTTTRTVLLAWLVIAGCMPVALSVKPTLVQEWEPPVPLPFEGDATPLLIDTDTPGLLAAPSVDETLYYYEPWERWFRYAFTSWFEAFSWDGHWFPPERIPPQLAALRPHRPPKPPVSPPR